MPVGPVERFIARIGRIPAALGKFLDRLARMGPPIGWIVKFFSTVWVGISFLVLTGMYIAIGSGFASFRARLEMTDLQFFDAWPMVTLLLLLAACLITVTLRKIPLTIYKLGVWTVHIGILIMLSGCFIYFSQKVEGLTRIYLGKTVDCFYDSTERSLYITRMDPADSTKAIGPEIMVPLPTLPFFHERLAVNPDDQSPGNPLNIPIPAEALAADPVLKAANLSITGYYPFATVESAKASVRIAAGNSFRWLTANTPAQRVLDMDTVGVELLYHPTPERIAALSAPAPDSRAITVRIPKLNLMKTYAATQDRDIAIEGTPYVLTPRDLTPPMQMASAGYEHAISGGIAIDVQRKDEDKTVTFQRLVLTRYPERSPDFVTVDGKSKRIQDRVDNDIEITFQDGTRDQFWLIVNDDDTLTSIHRKVGGGVEVKPAKPGDRLGPILSLAEYTLLPVAQWTPNSARPMSLTAADVIQYSAIEMHIAAGAVQINDVPVPFIEFAGAQGSRLEREPTLLKVPGVGLLKMVLSTTRRSLPSLLTLTQFDLKKYAGASDFIEDYTSTVRVVDRDTHAEKTVVAHLNSPAEDHGQYLFQAQWDGIADAPPAKRFTVLGVGNRPGIRVMVTGAILMVIGVLYSFYIKPILLNKRRADLAAFAAKGAA